MKNTFPKKTVTSSFRIQNFGKPRGDSPHTSATVNGSVKTDILSRSKNLPFTKPEADYSVYHPKDIASTYQKSSRTNSYSDSKSNGESNSDSGYPSASSDDDISEHPPPTTPINRSYVPRQQSVNIPTNYRKFFDDPDKQSPPQKETTPPQLQERLPVRPLVKTSRFVRQASLPGETMELTTALSSRMRKDSMTSSSESVDSMESRQRSVQPRVERLMGRLRRGSSSVHRSDLDNVVPLNIGKSYNDSTLRRGSTPASSVINGVSDGVGSGGGVSRLGFRRTSESAVDYTPPPDRRESGVKGLPADAMQRLRRLSSSSSFNYSFDDDISNNNKSNSSDSSSNSSSTNHIRRASGSFNDNNNSTYYNNNRRGSYNNESVLVRAHHRFRTASESGDPMASQRDIAAPTEHSKMEIKTQIRPIVEKFTVTRTITGTANPTIRRVGRSGSIIMRSQPTSRSQSPTRDVENDANDDVEMALAIRKAFENAPWSTDY